MNEFESKADTFSIILIYVYIKNFVTGNGCSESTKFLVAIPDDCLSSTR
jgi:hypothetical protein